MYSATFINELYEKVYLKCVGRLNLDITMDLGESPIYPKRSTIEVYLYAAVSNKFIKTAIDQLSSGTSILDPNKKPKRRAKKSWCIQSLDTALTRIERKEPKEILNEMQNVNNKIIKKAVKNGEFDTPFDASLDTHNIYRYTKIKDQKERKRKCDDIQKVVGTKPKDGCYYAHQYMTIKAVNGYYNPTLIMEPVLPFANKVKMASELIDIAEKNTRGQIDCILGDGDFDSVGMINMLRAKNKHFIFRADKDAKVKKIIKEKLSGLWVHIEYNYTRGEGGNTATYNLVCIDVNLLELHKVEMPKHDKKERYLTYATDLAPERGEDIIEWCVNLVKRYKKRWGIETGYRDKIEFRARTHALSYSIRLFLFLISVILYNIWIEVNTEYRHSPERMVMYPDGIPKSQIGFLLQTAILTLRQYFSKGKAG